MLIARVSSKDQDEEGFSLEAQIKILTSYCSPASLQIGKVYKIAESASKSEQRKNLQRGDGLRCEAQREAPRRREGRPTNP